MHIDLISLSLWQYFPMVTYDFFAILNIVLNTWIRTGRFNMIALDTHHCRNTELWYKTNCVVCRPICNISFNADVVLDYDAVWTCSVYKHFQAALKMALSSISETLVTTYEPTSRYNRE
jgi:hypothetical protein